MKFIIALTLAVGVVASSVGSTYAIAGGDAAKPHEIPSILNYGTHRWDRCGGATLIHPQWAITTAQCAEVGELVAGDHFIDKDEGTEQKIKIHEIYVHPEYQKAKPFYNNVALIKLATPFKTNDYVQVAQLPPRNFKATREWALIAGWGKDENSKVSPELHKIETPIFYNWEACVDASGNIADDSIICAGAFNKGSCGGDEGGPMFCESPKGKVLCGIISWPSDRVCGIAGNPIQYANTSHFLDWIKKMTGIAV